MQTVKNYSPFFEIFSLSQNLNKNYNTVRYLLLVQVLQTVFALYTLAITVLQQVGEILSIFSPQEPKKFHSRQYLVLCEHYVLLILIYIPLFYMDQL